MSHTQKDGNVEHHDHREIWDASDVDAREHFEAEGIGDRDIALRLGRTVPAVRSNRYRTKRKRG